MDLTISAAASASVRSVHVPKEGGGKGYRDYDNDYARPVHEIAVEFHDGYSIARYSVMGFSFFRPN